MRASRFVSLLLLAAAPARGAPVGAWLDLTGDYTLDSVATTGPGSGKRLTVLDNLNLVGIADLDVLAGLGGARLHIHLLNNLGGMPNDRAATLQGINNIEVTRQRLRLFQLLLGLELAPDTDVLAGLYDLNSEFYTNPAAGLLIGPAFGVGSEIAATGPNGPAIFPSSALAVRIEHRGGGGRFVRAAIVNAAAGTLGDPQGVDLDFDTGALAIAEAGVTGPLRLSVGAWRYTRRKPRIGAELAPAPGDRARAQGVYMVAEHPLRAWSGTRMLSGFVRAGLSDGQTTPYRGGWQAGLLWSEILPGRADSAFSLGLNQGVLARRFRDRMRAEGLRPARAETAFEVTLADRIAPWLVIQPNLQLVRQPGGVRGRASVLVSTLRLRFELPSRAVAPPSK